MRHSPRRNKGFTRQPLAVALGLIATSIAFSTSAQDSPRLEELIVTSQKRTESLQEVPLSVATISGEKLESAGIENLGDLTVHLPNLHFTETGFSTQVRVRGIGSDNSQGFEQSVGMYIDGIYYGRAQLFRAPLMDMQRAELLRGPQSTLFGKNSIAGALNLTTAAPTDELEGKVSISQETEFNTTEINGVISGPLTENLQARLAVRQLTDDGYSYNSYLNVDHPQREETGARLSLTWQATDNLDLYLKAEQSKFDTIGRAIEITHDVALDEGAPTYNQYLNILNQPGFEAELNNVRQTDQEEFSQNEINNLTFKADYALGDNTLTAITGWLEFNYDELCDCDFVAAEILNLDLAEDYQQFSQEFRLASPQGETFEWLAGAFYQSYEQTFSDQINISETNLLTNFYPVMAGTGLRRDFDQTSSSWAAFGRVTWNASDAWHITLGARYTEETKDASKILDLLTLETGQPLVDPLVGITYMGAFRAENEQATIFPDSGDPILHSGYNVKGSRSESAFTPLLNVEFDINGDMMAYAAFTTGFKAGGFDPRSNNVGSFDYRAVDYVRGTDDFPPPAETESNPLLHYEFEEETATAMEIGMKNTLWDGRAELNFSVYRTLYDDLQISQFDGGVGFNVGNAKETIVQGLEVDGRILLLDELTVHYGMSYLDFEYKDFKNGNCYAGQEKDGVDLDGNSTIDTCDYTGKRGVYTPKLTLNLSVDYYRPLTNQLNWVSILDWQYVDGQQVHVNLDPMGEIEGYNMLGLRLGIDAANWSVAVLGKNLLDETIVSYSGNAPLSDSQFNTNTHYSFVRRPRTIALEAAYRF